LDSDADDVHRRSRSRLDEAHTLWQRAGRGYQRTSKVRVRGMDPLSVRRRFSNSFDSPHGVTDLPCSPSYIARV